MQIFQLNRIQKKKDIIYDEKADIWNLGVIFYQLLIGRNPINCNEVSKLFNLVKKGDYYVPTTLSKESISFLNCMLQFDSKKRECIDVLYNHEFLKKNPKEFKIIKEKINLDEIKLNMNESNEFINK